MCVGQVLQGVGAVLSIGGMLSGANSASGAAKAAIATARDNAAFIYNRGAFEEGRILDNEARAAGGVTAWAASAGVDPTYGSPLLLQGFNAAQANVDRQLVKASAAGDAAGQYQQGASTAQSLFDRARALRIGAATQALKLGSQMSKNMDFGGGSSGLSGGGAGDFMSGADHMQMFSLGMGG